MLDARGSAVPLRCVNLSPWLVHEDYLMLQPSLAGLSTSPSQIKARLQSLLGEAKSAAFWRLTST